MGHTIETVSEFPEFDRGRITSKWSDLVAALEIIDLNKVLKITSVTERDVASIRGLLNIKRLKGKTFLTRTCPAIGMMKDLYFKRVK